jgi:hypothetical protein
LHRCRAASFREDFCGTPVSPGLARQGSGQLVRRAGLAIRDVVLRAKSQTCRESIG